MQITAKAGQPSIGPMWISWSTVLLVCFIARVSRGRTVREFYLLAVLLIPSLACVLWMTVFGTTAIQQFIGGYEDVANAATAVTALYHAPTSCRGHKITSFIGIILVVGVFLSPHQTRALWSLTPIAAGGKVNAPNTTSVYSGVRSKGFVAIALILGGGLIGLASDGSPLPVYHLPSCS